MRFSMKNLRQRWRKILILLFFIPFTISAQINNSVLQDKINALLNTQRDNITRRAVLLTSAEKVAALCADPQLALSNGQRLTGNRTVVAQCGNKKHFLQIRIEAEGRWWAAARDLKAGSMLTADDLIQQRGSMANLPTGVMTDSTSLSGAVLTRSVRAGQPLTDNLLRKSWRINRGEEIDVIAYGNGFHIMARGKTLDNGAINDAVRVRMKNGQLVTGSVNQDGSVRINL